MKKKVVTWVLLGALLITSAVALTGCGAAKPAQQPGQQKDAPIGE